MGTHHCPGIQWEPITVQAYSGNPSLPRHTVGTHHCPGIQWEPITVQVYSGNPSLSRHRVGTHHCPGIEWEPITVWAGSENPSLSRHRGNPSGKPAHMQLIRECSSTVISDRCAPVCGPILSLKSRKWCT